MYSMQTEIHTQERRIVGIRNRFHSPCVVFMCSLPHFFFSRPIWNAISTCFTRCTHEKSVKVSVQEKLFEFFFTLLRSTLHPIYKGNIQVAYIFDNHVLSWILSVYSIHGTGSKNVFTPVYSLLLMMWSMKVRVNFKKMLEIEIVWMLDDQSISMWINTFSNSRVLYLKSRVELKKAIFISNENGQSDQHQIVQVNENYGFLFVSSNGCEYE